MYNNHGSVPGNAPRSAPRSASGTAPRSVLAHTDITLHWSYYVIISPPLMQGDISSVHIMHIAESHAVAKNEIHSPTPPPPPKKTTEIIHYCIYTIKAYCNVVFIGLTTYIEIYKHYTDIVLIDIKEFCSNIKSTDII